MTKEFNVLFDCNNCGDKVQELTKSDGMLMCDRCYTSRFLTWVEWMYPTKEVILNLNNKELFGEEK